MVEHLPLRVRIVGAVFLIFQLLFAANNYGPHRIPGLSLLFDGPFVRPQVVVSETSISTVWLEDATRRAGLDAFVRAPFNDANPNYLEVMAGGVAVGDVDGDGLEDVFLTGLPSFGEGVEGSPSMLFRNLGDGRFENMTAAYGLDSVHPYAQGALFADFDNDGDQDLYVATYGSGQFFLNEGGTFRDVTETAGLSLAGACGELPCFGSSAAAADYDRDGYLDLLVVNNAAFDLDDPSQRGERFLFPAFFDAQPSFLFRNRGDGTFENVSDESGLRNTGGKGLAAIWTDVNGDGWPDVYIANDLSRNTLYLNQADGTFINIAAGAGVDEIKSSMGLAVADVDHDGDMDLAITNLKGSKVSFFTNLGDLRFRYDTDAVGLGASGRASGWGAEFVDLDLDGYPDLVVAGGPVWERRPSDTQNLIFRNLGDGRFADITETSGLLHARIISRGLAVFDADNSGSPDILFLNVDGAPSSLFLNTPNEANNWLHVQLEGTESNRDAIGARVELERTDGLKIVQEVRAGSSYQSTSSRTLFFGLGSSTPAELTVHWPSGKVERVVHAGVNQKLVVKEGG